MSNLNPITINFPYSVNEATLNELGEICMQHNSPAHDVVVEALRNDAFESFEGHHLIGRQMEIMACDISKFGANVKYDFDIDPDKERDNVLLTVSMTSETLRKSLG